MKGDNENKEMLGQVESEKIIKRSNPEFKLK